MGYRTVVIFNNDTIDRLKTEQDIGNQLYDAILQKRISAEPVNVSNIASVVDSVHLDETQLVIIGQGGSFNYDVVSKCWWNQLEPTLNLLKKAADKICYRLVKK